MAQRNTYKGTLIPLDKVWTDDKIVLDGLPCRIVKTETRMEQIVIPRANTIITYEVTEGPLRGSIRVKSYFPEDEIEVDQQDDFFSRMTRWFKRRNTKRESAVWHSHSLYRK